MHRAYIIVFFLIVWFDLTLNKDFFVCSNVFLIWSSTAFTISVRPEKIELEMYNNDSPGVNQKPR